MNSRTISDALTPVMRDAERRRDKAVDEILDLVWELRDRAFDFGAEPEVDAEVNAILRELSDGCRDDARRRAIRALQDIGAEEWEDESIEYSERDINGISPLWRLDMHSSHLKELLAVWIAVAAVRGWTREQLKLQMGMYIDNPFASPYWIGPAFTWGKGYRRNIAKALGGVMRNMVNRAMQYGELKRLAKDGAIGYEIMRGSNYHCPLCDSYTGRVYPLDMIILPLHVNCCCWVKPVYKI